MIGQCVSAIGYQVFYELEALLLSEAGADADVLQRARIVEKAKQQRAYGCALTVSVPPKAGDDAIAISLVLDLEHYALARLINA
jgi:hypothetical protein